MIRRPPRSTQSRSSAASDVYKRQSTSPPLEIRRCRRRPGDRSAMRPAAISGNRSRAGAGTGGGGTPIPTWVACGRPGRPWARLPRGFLEHHRAKVAALLQLHRHAGRLVSRRRQRDGILFARLQPIDEHLAEVVAHGLADGRTVKLDDGLDALGALVGVAEHERAGDERLVPAIEVPVVHPRPSAEAVTVALQALVGHAPLHLRGLGDHQLDGIGGADLAAARLAPAVVKEVGAAGALLRQLLVLVPVDGVVGAARDDLLAALRLDRVYDHEAVVALVDGAVGGEARRLVAVHAGHRQVGGLYDRVLAALLALDVHPAVAVPRLGRRVRRKLVVDELVLVGQEAIVAVVATGDVDDQVPALHWASPSHFSTWIRQELLDIAVEVGVMNRLLVRMLTQPAMSGDSPGSPSGR